MSDLRTRIAAALLQRFFARADVALDAADAVIAELGPELRGYTVMAWQGDRLMEAADE